MASRLRRFTKKTLLIINVVVAAIFLLSCLAPYLNPMKWWFISLLGLGFAFFFAVMVFFIFLWLIISPRLVLVSIVPLLIGWKSVAVFFAFNSPREFKYANEDKTVRVASWNVARFIELIKNNNKGSQTRLKMMDLLKEQDADILCLQEFHHATDSNYYDNISYIQKNLNYPYYYFTWDEDGSQLYYSSIIFSRYPIIDTGVVRYPRPSISEVLIHADIRVKGDTIRVYTTHLQSVQFRKTDLEKIEDIKNAEDSLLLNSKSIFSKLRNGITRRSMQADMIKQLLPDCPYPIIFCADLNDVPNSYTYFTIKDGMQDAFLQKGFGIGRSFSSLAPTLRIDYIFASRDFSVQQFNRLVKNYSDHYLLLADLKLK